MSQFCQLEWQQMRFARGRSVLVRVALSLLMVSVLGGLLSVYSTLRACCEEGSEEVRLQEESVAVAHRRIRQKSFESKHRLPDAFRYSHIAPGVSGVSTTQTLDRSRPAWFLLGAGIRILC